MEMTKMVKIFDIEIHFRKNQLKQISRIFMTDAEKWIFVQISKFVLILAKINLNTKRLHISTVFCSL